MPKSMIWWLNLNKKIDKGFLYRLKESDLDSFYFIFDKAMSNKMIPLGIPVYRVFLLKAFHPSHQIYHQDRPLYSWTFILE